MKDEYQSPFFEGDDDIMSSSPEQTDDLFSNSENQLDLNSFANSVNTEEENTEKPLKCKKTRHEKREEKERKRAELTTGKKVRNAVLKSLLSFFLVMTITACLVVGGFLFYVFAFVDDDIHENLYDLKLNSSAIIYVKDAETGEYIQTYTLHGSEKRIWVSYDETQAKAKKADYTGIPQNLANAFVAIEDQRFFTHNGVDWKRTVAAFANMFVDLYSSNQGGSTITQQLVKNLTQDNEQSPMRKIREIMRARKIESTVDKATILECYLNTISFANGIGGVQVAANYYYGKDVHELTVAECAGLAAIVKEPERYRPDKHPKNNKERRKLVLDKMLELGYITEAQYNEAKNEDVVIVADKSAIRVDSNPYFIDALIDDVVNDLQKEFNMSKAYAEQNFYNGGYKIYCTIDPQIQSVIDEHYTNLENFRKNNKGVYAQSSFTIMDYEGHVVGIVGGVGKKEGNRGLNRATSSPRPPGSSIKPISVYSLALDNDIISYSTLLRDEPTMTVKDKYGNNKKWPTNAGGTYTGNNVTMAYALQKSYNTIPVQLVQKLGKDTVLSHVRNTMGVKNYKEPFDYTDANGTIRTEVADATESSLALGGSYKGMTTLESCAAFATFGNKGKYYEPTFYTKVTNHRGETVLNGEPTAQLAISEDTSVILNHMLQNVVTSGTGSTVKKMMGKMPTFGKTGTTDDNYNLWFAGGTPYYVASCWYGYDNPEKVSDSKAAQKVWGTIMKNIHKDLDTQKLFPTSNYVTCRKYCTQSGMLATENCTSTAKGWYKTSQLIPCNIHGGGVLDEIDPESSGTTKPTTSSNTTQTSSTSSNASSGNISSNAPSTSSGSVSSGNSTIIIDRPGFGNQTSSEATTSKIGGSTTTSEAANIG